MLCIGGGGGCAGCNGSGNYEDDDDDDNKLDPSLIALERTTHSSKLFPLQSRPLSLKSRHVNSVQLRAILSDMVNGETT